MENAFLQLTTPSPQNITPAYTSQSKATQTMTTRARDIFANVERANQASIDARLAGDKIFDKVLSLAEELQRSIEAFEEAKGDIEITERAESVAQKEFKDAFCGYGEDEEQSSSSE
jgi:hypothetical protein